MGEDQYRARVQDAQVTRLAGALLRLSDFLTRHGQAVWERFPLDAEALYQAAEENAKWRYDGYVRRTKIEY